MAISWLHYQAVSDNRFARRSRAIGAVGEAREPGVAALRRASATMAPAVSAATRAQTRLADTA